MLCGFGDNGFWFVHPKMLGDACSSDDFQIGGSLLTAASADAVETRGLTD